MSNNQAGEAVQPDGQDADEALDPRIIAAMQAELAPETVRQILLTAVAEMREKGRGCLAALPDAEHEALRRAAHALVGIADTVGAVALAARAREVEIVAAQARLPPPQAVAELERLVAVAALAVERWLEKAAGG